MSDAVIVEPAILPEADDVSHSPFSWSAAIAGTLAAMAVSFIVIALGSGIGLSFASPFSSGPSATNLTLAAAVWLVLAQTLGFATGGYLAGRLRSPAFDGVAGETLFRDAAQGFVVWAIGTVIMACGSHQLFRCECHLAGREQRSEQRHNEAWRAGWLLGDGFDYRLFCGSGAPTRPGSGSNGRWTKAIRHDSWRGSSIARAQQRCSRRGHADTRPRDRTR
jgi:hypothetical protein